MREAQLLEQPRSQVQLGNEGKIFCPEELQPAHVADALLALALSDVVGRRHRKLLAL